MSNKPWIVKTRSGDIWGKIHRVIIDSASRQIVWVDVMLGGKDRVIRVPWTSFHIEEDDIVLAASEGDMHASIRPYEGRLPDSVMLEESASPCHA